MNKLNKRRTTKPKFKSQEQKDDEVLLIVLFVIFLCVTFLIVSAHYGVVA